MIQANKNWWKILKEILFPKNKEDVFKPTYRIVEVTKMDDKEYIITIQIINKSATFRMKPEEILSKDSLVDQFSPRDIRTLTYLGYLGINSPKFKILAQRLSENNDNTLFAIKEKGQKNVILKTASELASQTEMISNLDAKDAHTVGYTLASDSIMLEKKQKEILLKELEKGK